MIRAEDIDNQILTLIDLGVEDVIEAEDGIEVYTKPDHFGEIRDKIQSLNYKIVTSELTRQAINETTLLEKEKAGKVLHFMNTLEELEDVQKVYANFDIPQEILGLVNV